MTFNVTDLDRSRAFYGGVLGCRESRSTATWVDFDFFGRQRSIHLRRPGEQWTMCFCDPSGNPIEITGFASLASLYAN